MFKRKFFSFGVLIVLIIACVILSTVLFVLSSVPAVNNPGIGIGTGGATGAGADDDDGLPKPAIDDWELPIVISITGKDSPAGRAAAWGLDYGIKVVNELGGIRGLPVRITVRDAASSTESTAQEIEALSADSLVIMGPQAEELFKAGEWIFYRAGVPVVGAATDANSRKNYEPFAVSCITNPWGAASSVGATWVSMESFDSVCMLYAPVYAERVDYIEASLVNAEKEIVERIEVGNEAFDAAGVADKLYNSGADVYYIDMRGEDVLRVIAQLRYLAGDNAGRLKILCGPDVADRELIESAAEGDMYGIQVWTTIDPKRDVEKRKAFAEAFDKNIGDAAFRGITVDYLQSALMLKQAIEALGLTGERKALKEERSLLAGWLYNTESIHTDHGDFYVQDGAKYAEVKIYTITDKGFQ